MLDRLRGRVAWFAAGVALSGSIAGGIAWIEASETGAGAAKVPEGTYAYLEDDGSGRLFHTTPVHAGAGTIVAGAHPIRISLDAARRGVETGRLLSSCRTTPPTTSASSASSARPPATGPWWAEWRRRSANSLPS